MSIKKLQVFLKIPVVLMWKIFNNNHHKDDSKIVNNDVRDSKAAFVSF